MLGRLIEENTREAPERSALGNLLHTAGQIVVFWSFFLALLPWLIRLVEDAVGIERLGATWLWPAGAGLFLAASALGLWSGITMAILGSGTPLPLSCARKLVLVGPYRHVRNPMALAGITQGFAVGVGTGSLATMAYALAGAFVWNSIARPPEEADLVRRFGEDFERYRRAVRCWWPRLTPYPGE